MSGRATTTWNIGSVAVTRVEEQLGITSQPCDKYFPNFERNVLERHLDCSRQSITASSTTDS